MGDLSLGMCIVGVAGCPMGHYQGVFVGVDHDVMMGVVQHTTPVLNHQLYYF